MTAINRQQDVIFDGCDLVAELSMVLGHRSAPHWAEMCSQTLWSFTGLMLACRTMMWPPFVKQCIAMVRDHEHNYVRGPGYKKDDDGNVTEQYVTATCAGCLSTCGVALARAFSGGTG